MQLGRPMMRSSKDVQHYPPGTQEYFREFFIENFVTINGQGLFYARRAGGVAIRKSKICLEPGFPAKDVFPDIKLN